MELRKIISFGKGSFIISLPKPWVTKHHLSKGSILSIEEGVSSLIISTSLSETKKEPKEITINADNKSLSEIRTEIVTAYLGTYDTIEIYSKSINSKDEQIKDAIKNLAGLEILEQTNSKITAKFLLDTREISIPSLIRRMDNITRSLIIDAIECIQGGCNYISIKQRDMDINRLHFLVMRSARKEMCSPKNNAWNLYKIIIIAEKLEKIADHQKRIARCLEQLKLSENFAQELKKVHIEIKDSFCQVMKSYYEKDKKLAMKIEQSNKKRIFTCDSILGKDIKKEYKMALTDKQLIPHVHEHMIMTEIISNLKAMTTSIKMIVRAVMNNN